METLLILAASVAIFLVVYKMNQQTRQVPVTGARAPEGAIDYYWRPG